MKKVCDLHIHSTFSDGKNTPTWLVEESERIGLSAISLCDHNTVLGLPEFVEAAKDKKVESIVKILYNGFATNY